MATKPRAVREDEEDFEAFWAQHRADENPEYKRIFGVRVAVPTDIPLSFEDTLDELKDSDRREDMARVLEILFGVDALDQWKAAGLTGKQFRVLLAWATANAYGKPTSFAEAVELVAKADAKKAEDEGKAVPLNRAARRASSKTGGSGSSGRSSKRTSPASTG